MLDEFSIITTPRNIDSQSFDQILTEDGIYYIQFN